MAWTLIRSGHSNAVGNRRFSARAVAAWLIAYIVQTQLPSLYHSAGMVGCVLSGCPPTQSGLGGPTQSAPTTDSDFRGLRSRAQPLVTGRLLRTNLHRAHGDVHAPSTLTPKASVSRETSASTNPPRGLDSGLEWSPLRSSSAL